MTFFEYSGCRQKLASEKERKKIIMMLSLVQRLSVSSSAQHLFIYFFRKKFRKEKEFQMSFL